MRTLSEIIIAAGGPGEIARASNGKITTDAVYKWQKIGVPDRHWPLLIDMAAATPGELFEANRVARGAGMESVA